MYYVTLKRIESNHNNLRTDEVRGLAPELPETGKSFFMYANALDKSGELVRFVHTSVVTSVDNEVESSDIVFRTANSLYVLKNIRRAEAVDSASKRAGKPE